MSCKIINVKPFSDDVYVKYCSRRNKKRNGLRNTYHDFYIFNRGNETLKVKTYELLKLLEPFVKQYKQKLIGWFNIFYIFDYKILKAISINNGIESK